MPPKWRAFGNNCWHWHCLRNRLNLRYPIQRRIPQSQLPSFFSVADFSGFESNRGPPRSIALSTTDIVDRFTKTLQKAPTAGIVLTTTLDGRRGSNSGGKNEFDGLLLKGLSQKTRVRSLQSKAFSQQSDLRHSGFDQI